LVGLAVALALATGGMSAQTTFQQPPRDSRLGPTKGTAALSGLLVTDDATPQPVRRARIAVSNTEGQAVQTVYTDDAGRFSVTGLAAGRYLIAATRPSYVRAAFGARRYDRPGMPITVVDGQRVTDVVIKMARGSVITGTIVDDMAQPVQGVSVRVMQYRMQNGERTLAPVPLGGGSLNEMTDDRGAYRIFGLPAGDYVISATQPRNTGLGDIRQMSAADLQAVQQALQPQAGATGASTPPAATVEPVMVGYAPVYYPGTTSLASATTVTLGAGEERTGVDFALQLVRTARIEGVVVTPQGVSPQDVQLLMLPNGTTTMGMPFAISFNRVSPGADGRFSYSGVTPGQYTITARASGRPGTPASQLWASADVNVDGQNILGVNLTMQAGMTVSGRIAVEAVGADKPSDFSRSRVTLAAAGPANGITIGVPAADVDPSGHFTFTGVTPGKYRLIGTLNSPEANWTLKSATAKGRDALDLPMDIGANENISDATLTFTNLTQEVSGVLQDASGRPAPDFTILVFPEEKAYWTAPRRIKTSRPGTDGRFVIKNVPAGTYRIAALVDIAPGDANDPAFLEQLVSASVAFTLHDGETKVQDLKIARQLGQ
jgi:hypothetical protein